MKIKMTLGAALRAAREERKLSLRDIQLLAQGEITNSYVSQLETGYVTTPHPRYLKTLSRIYQLDLLYLYELCGYLTQTDGTKGVAK